MRDCRGRYQDGGAWGKFHNQVAVPKNEVTPPFGIELAQRCDSTPAEGDVARVHMLEASRPRPKIDGHGSIDAVSEVLGKVGVVCKDRAEKSRAVAVEFWRPSGECIWNEGKSDKSHTAAVQKYLNRTRQFGQLAPGILRTSVPHRLLGNG